MIVQSTKPYLPEGDIRRILKKAKQALRTGRLYDGPFVREFEERFRLQAGAQYAVATSSGTAALEIILRHYGVEGKEVITPTNTFIATSNGVLFAGGRPVLADMDPETLSLAPSDVERRIGKKTKGVVLVHVNGLITPRVKKIRALCRKRGLFLIEDASHAHGAQAFGKPAGSWGDAAAFSCLATKVMTTGGVGGVITTNDAKLYFFARSLRFHGEDKVRGIQNRIGNDWCMTELQAAVGILQTKRLPEMVRKRMRIAGKYDRAFGGIPYIGTFSIPEGFRASYYKYPLLLSSARERSRMRGELKKKGIATGGIYWPPVHLQPAYRKLFKYKKGDFPIAEDILSRTITLPIFPGMTAREVEYVIKNVKNILPR